MTTSYSYPSESLRFYSNPLKLLFLLAIALGFAFGGYWLLQSGKVVGNTFNEVMAYLCIIFFGFGALVFIVGILRNILFRQPLVEVSAQGWHFRANPFAAAQHIGWQDIAQIAIHRQKASHSTTYWLVLQARYPERLPPSRLRTLNAIFYPSIQTAVGKAPLNQFFFRATSEKCLQALDQIVAAFGKELQQYGIQVPRTIYPL